uniref:CBM21 domain-containing protein n=1 Tax=Ixodes ricinus TaxID=34613 RepID=A0A131XW12_IXORI
MDERPSVVQCPPVRQLAPATTTPQGSQSALLVRNGTGPWEPHGTQEGSDDVEPTDTSANFLVRTGRALYERLYSLLQDESVDCVVQCGEESVDEPSSTSSLDLGDSDSSPELGVDGRVSTPPAVTSLSSVAVSSPSDDLPASYPPEREVVRAALSHHSLPDDSFPFPIVHGLVRPGGASVLLKDGNSSVDLVEEAFQDATDGLAEEFRDDGSSTDTGADVAATDAAADVCAEVIDTGAVASAVDRSDSSVGTAVAESTEGPGSAEPDNKRPRSKRFAKHRFQEAAPLKQRNAEGLPAALQAVTLKPYPADGSPSSSPSSASDVLSPTDTSPSSSSTPRSREDSDDEDSASRGPLLRSTSLKTGKSPPGTPYKKKIVRFADAMGLDLAAVRTIVSGDVPNIPASAFSHLDLERQVSPPRTSGPSLVLAPLFAQPGASSEFLTRLTAQKVCLESVVVTGCAIHAVIRVLNVAFEKLVILRYSLDQWRSFCDLRAVYLPGSSDGLSDRFGADLYLSENCARPMVQMCVRYVVGDREFWDNNGGTNYRFEFRESPRDEPEMTPLMNYL